MDPDAKIQVATLGTALYFSKDNVGKFIGKAGSYNKSDLNTALGGYTRVYGLASTPDLSCFLRGSFRVSLQKLITP